jgi:hypothetical protein
MVPPLVVGNPGRRTLSLFEEGQDVGFDGHGVTDGDRCGL